MNSLCGCSDHPSTAALLGGAGWHRSQTHPSERETPWPNLGVRGEKLSCPPKPPLGKVTGKGREMVPRREQRGVQNSPSRV